MGCGAGQTIAGDPLISSQHSFFVPHRVFPQYCFPNYNMLMLLIFVELCLAELLLCLVCGIGGIAICFWGNPGQRDRERGSGNYNETVF